METLTIATPTNLIEQAIEKGLGVAELEKLVALQERWEERQARKAFFDSFTNFQCECPDLRKTKSVSFKDDGKIQYKYAPLADITRQIGQLLKTHGLSYRWEISDTEKEIRVSCLITHIDGHTETTTMMANPDTSGAKNQIQARGSAIEYLKRYTLIGALGLSTADTDVDGRMPEHDIDKLHSDYMVIYKEILTLDTSLTKMDPDNWKIERSAKAYIKATGEARKVLLDLKSKKK